MVIPTGQQNADQLAKAEAAAEKAAEAEAEKEAEASKPSCDESDAAQPSSWTRKKPQRWKTSLKRRRRRHRPEESFSYEHLIRYRPGRCAQCTAAG